jgi:hypothetical protein
MLPRILMLALLAASQLPAQRGVTSRDSAGIRILTASIDRVPLLTWRVGTPVRLPGEAEPFYQLAGATRRGRAGTVVGDRGALVLRTFDAAGAPGATIGRSGEGPGEFRSITSVGHGIADSLWAHDMINARLQLFDAAGRPAGTVPMLPTSGAFGEVIGVRGTQVIGVSLPAIRAGMAEGLRRDSLEIYPVDRRGNRGHRVAIVPGRDQVVRIASSGNRLTVSKSTLPFGYLPLYTMAGSRVAVGGSERYAIRLHDLDGRVTTIVRVAVPPLRVAGPLLRSWAEAEARESGEPSRAGAIERRARDLPLHEFAPELDAIAPDLATGGFWVRRFSAPGAPSAEWVVHAGDGAPLGRLTLPAGWTVQEAGTDYLIAIEYTPDGEGEVLAVPIRR